MNEIYKSLVNNRHKLQKEILPSVNDFSPSEDRLSRQMDRNQEKREKAKKDNPELSDFIDNGTLILSNFGR
jgi:hypothetical protein